MFVLGRPFDGVESVMTDFARSKWDPSHIGRKSSPYTFTVELGAITKVAAASDILRPWSSTTQRAHGPWQRNVEPAAPLFYLWTLLNNTPNYRVYEDWVMHGLEPGSAHIHTGDDYFYWVPIRVGDQITVTCELTKVYEKHGRQGRLVFIEDTWDYRNQRNELAARLVRKAVTVYYENRDTNIPYQPVELPPGEPTTLAEVSPIDWADLAKGKRLYDVDLGPLSRTSMVRWMGAVDDYAATHYDPDYAVEREFPNGQPLAAGPHMGALLAAPVSAWIGADGWLAEFHHLQRHEVFPKDRLRTLGVVSRAPSAADPTVEIETWLVDERGLNRNSGTFVVAPVVR